NQRVGRIPLVIGMPVVISHNFDVDGGVVNGSVGTLKRIRFFTNAVGVRHATSVVVHIPDSSPDPLPDLPPHHVVALQET
ncbi:hypothetical protein FA95DRAFT_1475167, partial [Auriscalpium vulgare]